MTIMERPEKRAVFVRCDHPTTEACDCRRTAVDEILARWAAGAQEPPAGQSGRETVVLADLRAPVVRPPYKRPPPPPLAITDDDERHGDSLLGAASAWACVALAVLLMLALAVRQLWLH